MFSAYNTLAQMRFDEKIIDASGTLTLITKDFVTARLTGKRFVFTSSSASTLQLPAAKAGYCLAVATRGTGKLTITPATDEYIAALSGIGYSKRSLFSNGRGARAMLVCNTDGYWDVYFENGIWSNDNTVSNADATSVTFTASDLCGQRYIYTGAGLTTVTMPAAVVGMKASFLVRGSGGVKIKPASGEQISANTGALGTADYWVTNTTAGTMITYECLTTGKWQTVEAIGTWTAVNA